MHSAQLTLYTGACTIPILHPTHIGIFPVSVFFSVCLDGGWEGGEGEAGDSPQPQFGVGDMWRVYVECVLLMAGLQPHLVRLIGLWLGGGCTPVVHEQSWHPG